MTITTPHRTLPAVAALRKTAVVYSDVEKNTTDHAIVEKKHSTARIPAKVLSYWMFKDHAFGDDAEDTIPLDTNFTLEFIIQDLKEQEKSIEESYKSVCYISEARFWILVCLTLGINAVCLPDLQSATCVSRMMVVYILFSEFGSSKGISRVAIVAGFNSLLLECLNVCLLVRAKSLQDVFMTVSAANWSWSITCILKSDLFNLLCSILSIALVMLVFICLHLETNYCVPARDDNKSSVLRKWGLLREAKKRYPLLWA